MIQSTLLFSKRDIGHTEIHVSFLRKAAAHRFGFDPDRKGYIPHDGPADKVWIESFMLFL